ncbi:mirror-image polydactyly gene 1 protein isoform X2 [Mastacembelus armatus]|uniref:mirror-image polydactyly gene 1 protein isoform X2 n=1 Tax=Mastacembelus armatus TaxID=205130 RepID=UPI000E464AA0|nr:mirror-image polydactyly gene 1 protein isoform X2 [Mastacembelus armatus]
MYRANPRVNVELQQRLPSPARQQLCHPDRSSSLPVSNGISLNQDHTDWPQGNITTVCQLLQEPPTSCSPSPVFQRSPVSPVSALPHRWSACPLSPRPPGGAAEMETHLSASRGPSPQAQSSGDAPEGRGASRGPGSPALRRHLVTNASSFHQDVFGQVQDLDRDKNISFLLKQLDALREVNTKLQDQLLQKEKELQRREVEEELREEQREARGWQRPAVVLEEVLAAQKDRDQAVMSRLLLANEERDEAVLRARRLQQAAATENLNLEDSDMDVSDLLQRVCDADSVQEVEQFGSVLVQRLRLARQRRDDITAQEMKAVMEERDGSVAKCKRLEQDLLQEREQRPAKEEILRLQRERDRALEDQQQLEVELQVLRSNHRSQGLLTPPASSSQGVSLPHQTPPLLTHLEQSTPLQTPPLQVQLHQLSKEREIMKAELRRCREAEQEASERIHRLERLVEVLRKKVGTGNLRAVI